MEWIAGVAGAIVSGVVAYLLGTRRQSGRINVSEAQQIWNAAEKLRNEYLLRIWHLEQEVLRLRRDGHQLRNELTKMQFVLTPNVPEEIKDGLIEASKQHIRELSDELERNAANKPDGIE